MFKAIKDNKIIAINDTDQWFPCLIRDEVLEDLDHTYKDYEQYNGEYILKQDVPQPTEEQQRQKRAEAYREEVDPITSQISRLRDEEQTTEIIEKIDELLKKRSEVVKDIQERYPYPVEEE